jgi:MerR family redox-sensitive transcriptional activator SoxR
MKKSEPKVVSTQQLTIGEVAKQTGVAISTIHFYEEKGLIGETNTGRRRRFSQDVLKRIALIKAAKNAGTPLGVVATLLMSLPKERAPQSKDWRLVLERWRTDLDARLGQLVELRAQLTRCTVCGCLSLETCPLASSARSDSHRGTPTSE